MCLGQVIISCPDCKRELKVTRPDSSHTCWSFDKPKDAEAAADFVEQVYVCKSPYCGAKFSVYWYET